MKKSQKVKESEELNQSRKAKEVKHIHKVNELKEYKKFGDVQEPKPNGRLPAKSQKLSKCPSPLMQPTVTTYQQQLGLFKQRKKSSTAGLREMPKGLFSILAEAPRRAAKLGPKLEPKQRLRLGTKGDGRTEARKETGARIPKGELLSTSRRMFTRPGSFKEEPQLYTSSARSSTLKRRPIPRINRVAAEVNSNNVPSKLPNPSKSLKSLHSAPSQKVERDLRDCSEKEDIPDGPSKIYSLQPKNESTQGKNKNALVSPIQDEDIHTAVVDKGGRQNSSENAADLKEAKTDNVRVKCVKCGEHAQSQRNSQVDKTIPSAPHEEVGKGKERGKLIEEIKGRK